MYTGSTKFYLVSETPDEIKELSFELLTLGFQPILRGLPRRDERLSFKKNDVIIIFTGYNSTAVWSDIITKLKLLNKINPDKVALFAPKLERKELKAIVAGGINYIDTIESLSSDKIIYMISQIDPELVYRASKVRALHMEKSSAIETGTLSVFNRLRDDPSAALTIEAAAHQRREMEDLLAMSPMSVWLQLFQNYHDGTARHCSLVAGFSLIFSRKLGFGERDIGRMYDAAFFHDVGKALVPLDILEKPGALTAEEWVKMKHHVLHGHKILMRDERTAGEIARIARDHHEYLDGSGYPNGISAARIDDPTRILTICDIFAALVEQRSYKATKTPDEAYEIIRSMAGTKLDPDLVRVFESVADEYHSMSRLKLQPKPGLAA